MGSELRIEYMAVTQLAGALRNPKKHDEEGIQASIGRFGMANGIVLDERTSRIVAGHGRRDALLKLKAAGKPPPSFIKALDGEWFVPVTRGWTSTSDQEAEAFLIGDNQLTENGGWDDDQLAKMLGELVTNSVPLAGTGYSEAEVKELLEELAGTSTSSSGSGKLEELFLVPPFSILDARKGYWQDRKRAWLSLGLRSSVGRGENLIGYGGEMKLGEIDTSIFDPVLCEVVYRWFSPPSGLVLDPFAGGSVRGIVANRLGRSYLGIDLRPEQVEANRAQAAKLCKEKLPVWVTGDSREIDTHAVGVEADLLFSCPPYADLEIYSDDPADLSNLSQSEFLIVHSEIIAAAAKHLKPNRLAVWVVGDVRRKDGTYLGFVPETIRAFEAAGLRLYNEIVLATALSTVPMRAGRAFKLGRKVGKTHQNVLVFLKGDAAKMHEELGPLEVPEDVFTTLEEEATFESATSG